MSFAQPQLLWLVVIPLGLLIWELTARRRASVDTSHPKIRRAAAGAHDIVLAGEPRASGASGIRPWLAAGLGLGIVAIARPQWGRLDEPVFDQSREILLAVDLSRSMLAPDIKPSRLERAKLLIQSLLERLEGERVGLVVFSGTAFLQSPLSSDYEILREFLPALDPEYLPEGGSNYGALLDTALDAFGAATAADRFLIVLSDGEATDEAWQSRLAELEKRGIRVIGLGVGTPGGAMIPDGTGGFVKDERGAVVLTKLENGTLQRLATETGGEYRDASAWIDLAALVNQTVNAGQQGQFVETRSVRLVERFQWPLALALWCLLVSLYYEFPVQPRSRTIALKSGKDRDPTPPTDRSRIPGTGAATLLAALLLTVSAFVPVADAAATASQSTASPTSAPLTEPPPPKPELSPLGQIVSRLSSAEGQSARDWMDMAKETAAWGNRLKSAQQSVPPGPVNDALAAVNQGENLDPKLTDWAKLREELEALLQKPEPPPEQQQQSKDGKDQEQPRQPDQKQQKPEGGKSDEQKEDQSAPPEQKRDPAPEEPKDGSGKPPEEKPSSSQERAFGDMKEPPPPSQPPSPPSETQKVGGAKDEKPAEPPNANPAVALQLEKLEQLKNQDSPAQLFQKMQADRTGSPQPKKPAKDW